MLDDNSAMARCEAAWLEPEETKGVYTCCICGADILDGETYLPTGSDEHICEECLKDDPWYVLEKYFGIYRATAKVEDLEERYGSEKRNGR